MCLLSLILVRSNFFLGKEEMGLIGVRYRKYELATRYAFLYTSVPIAGGLSGLLAGVITQYMDGVGGIAGWRWLFVGTMVDHHFLELTIC